MSPCDEYSVKALRYLDHDLSAQELEDFRAHLKDCEGCRIHLEAEQALSNVLHQSRPLYSAPPELRTRVSAAIDQQRASSLAGRKAWQILAGRLLGAGRRLRNVRVLVPAVVTFSLCMIFVPNMVRQVRAASYVETAVSTHRSYVAGNLAPGVLSNSPEFVTSWFADKVPFNFHLPNAEFGSQSKPIYRLSGASLVKYKGSPAAAVTYETQSEKISLMVAPSDIAVVAGGDEVQFGSLTFHYYTESNFKVITWSNHGLSYALVSSVAGPARASCLVCHQDMSDRDEFRKHQ